ncbi:MAG TPA: type II toxin-antitoxin system death-on-curing family toxin [Polyangiaceae bacterium]|nr:type II toxin-antitoxin system death-on-curing family toxin [Polyangiaceae bacterium]
MKPRFLRLDQLLELHAGLLERHGGGEGVRDVGLLESALAAAQNEHAYGDGDLFAVASAYAFHLAKNHPFVDGNKRAALAAALLFMQLHGVTCVLEGAELERLVLDLIGGTLSKTELAERLRRGTRGKAPRLTL